MECTRCGAAVVLSRSGQVVNAAGISGVCPADSSRWRKETEGRYIILYERSGRHTLDDLPTQLEWRYVGQQGMTEEGAREYRQEQIARGATKYLLMDVDFNAEPELVEELWLTPEERTGADIALINLPHLAYDHRFYLEEG